MADRLRHDCAYAAMLAIMEQPFMAHCSQPKASVAFDVYKALMALIESYEIQKAREMVRVKPSRN